MKIGAVFVKALREQSRDRLMLALVLVFAPIFVLLYRVWFPSGSTTYGVLLLDQDAGIQAPDGSLARSGDGVLAALEAVTYADGSPMLQVRPVAGRAEAESLLREREAAALLVLPPGFSQAIVAAGDGRPPAAASIVLSGDLTNPYYAVAAIVAGSAVDAYVQSATGLTPPIGYVEEPLGASAARTEFENYVPGLFAFATMMLMFSTAMVVVREVETGTVRRLQMARVSAAEFLGGITAAQVLVGLMAVVLTFLTAYALGFRSEGPMAVVVLVGGITSLSIVGIGLMVASVSRTAMQAFLIANFPLALCMFFSSAVFPIPRVPLFTIGGRSIGLYDVLPPTHAVAALNKILTFGAGPGEVVFELAALSVLSVTYFALGVWLFKRTHLRR